MEKSQRSSMSSGEPQCVGRLEIVRPKPVGFLCGSIPVPTDNSFHDFNSAALVPSPQTVTAPRYRMIPAETDLNTLPLLPSIPDMVLPVAATQTRTGGDTPWEGGSLSTNLTRKGEALAVSGLVEHGDELDVIAPADILKQIFKIPYSKARLSIAVHRVGQTLVLNTGPDVEEGEKLVRRHKKQSKCAEQSLFLNFAMHSVRMEACDCPPTHHSMPNEQSDPTVFPHQVESREGSFESSENPVQGHTSYRPSNNDTEEEAVHSKQGKIFWQKKNKRRKEHESLEKVSKVKEKPSAVRESEKCRSVDDDSFLRVLFWQFHNFRMLLGSDLLIFSNEKYVAVSLHLWDVSRQVTPLTWLEAWLDNVMASVPELAICYHQDGVVQGYELLKTDDIHLLKGISDDGTPAFNPHVVRHNGLSVLRFLQENCKQDPGAYWLYKSAGEDVIQLFDLSVIPTNHSSDNPKAGLSSLPALVHAGRSDSLQSLGTLLYRIAHRLSLSMSSKNRARCARFFRKCLDFLDEPDYLVVRASAHEQFARLLLTYNEELEMASEAFSTECEVTVADEESFEIFSGVSELSIQEIAYTPVPQIVSSIITETIKDSEPEDSRKMKWNDTTPSSTTISPSTPQQVVDLVVPNSTDEEILISDSEVEVEKVADPISSKLAAVHHVSQAIKSLRWKRQLQSTQVKDQASKIQDELPPMDFSVCACGDTDCIEVCDIREWLPTSKLDDKLWKLVLLLGESYLALGEAYKDDSQLRQAMKVVELACLVYGSMPQHLEDSRFISSMVCSYTPGDKSDKTGSVHADITLERLSSNYIFWYKAWTLVGDLYVAFNLSKDKEISPETERKYFTKDLKMSSEVVKEVERLRKKLGQFNQNCSSCSLINCSCQSDRASSGSSASSSSGATRPIGVNKKKNRKVSAKATSYAHLGNHEDEHVHQELDNRSTYINGSVKPNIGNIEKETSDLTANSDEVKNVTAINSMTGHGAMAGTGEDTSETTARKTNKMKNGGIFKYIRGRVIGDTDDNLSAALSCYEGAQKALHGNSTSEELHSLLKKKGWVCNELGRIRIERKDLDKAEIAFAEAIKAFKQVSDHVNIIIIYCNLGHGRRALAEEMLPKIESLKKNSIFQNAYRLALETAKNKYSESLRFYGAAKAEICDESESEEAATVSVSLRNEVYTQYANTYLRLGMLLAQEDTVARVYENSEDHSNPIVGRTKSKGRKREISANDAIREALAIYESLGDLRKQEAAYSYFQLACYQRDCCLKFLKSEERKNGLVKGENSGAQRMKQYALLAERNWQKAMDFYGPNIHPNMYLTILIERSALSLYLSSLLHSNALLDSALTRMLEGRHLSENKSLTADNTEVCAKFWSQLQKLLKKMLSITLAATTSKSSVNSHQGTATKSADLEKLKELYKMSLKSTEFSQLHAMHNLWTSSCA